MEEDCQRALEPSFTYGCGCNVFKHNICGDQLEVLDRTPDSPNFLSPECIEGFGAPLPGYPLETQLPRSIVERWKRSQVEVPLLGI